MTHEDRELLKELGTLLLFIAVGFAVLFGATCNVHAQPGLTIPNLFEARLQAVERLANQAINKYQPQIVSASLTFTGPLYIPQGAGAGKALVSNAAGVATWGSVGSGSLPTDIAYLDVTQNWQNTQRYFSSGTGDTLLVFKGFAGQSADIFDYFNSSGTILSKLKAGGDFIVPNAHAFGSINAAGSADFSMIFADGSDIVNVGSSSNPSLFLNPGGVTLVRLRNSGGVKGMTVGDNTSPTAMLYVRGQTTSQPTVIVQSVASQTVDFARFQNSVPTVLTQITYPSATWVGPVTVADTTDLTKLVKVSPAGQSTATQLTLATSNTASRTQTFPDTTGTILVAGGGTWSNARIRLRGSSTTNTYPPLDIKANGGANNSDLFYVSSNAGKGDLFKVDPSGNVTAGGTLQANGGIQFADVGNSNISVVTTNNTASGLPSHAFSNPLSASGTGYIVEADGNNLVNLTAQTATLGPTTILTTAAAGFYRMSINATCSTAGVSGTLDVSGTWTQGGVARTTNLAATVGINRLAFDSTANSLTDSMNFYCDNATAIQYTATVSAPVGTPKYDLHVRVEYLGP